MQATVARLWARTRSVRRRLRRSDRGGLEEYGLVVAAAATVLCSLLVVFMATR